MDTKTLIKRLGGTAKTAELCEVTPGAVSQWRKSGIPKARLMFIRLARPEIFGAPTLRRRKTKLSIP
jgi:predicted transcriptional regulator